MSENRKYYYMKLKENFFTDAKMVILESMQDGLLYSNLLLKMYLMSLKYNGILMLNDHLPHTPQTISTFTRHQIGTVERAIKVFLEFGFVEILTDGSYYMADIQLLIGQSSTEGERKRKERMRLKRQNLLPPAYGCYQNVFLTDDELTELQKELPALWQTYVDRLSEYMASTGKQYQNHAATIRRWAAEDRKKAATQTRNRDYSVREGETV